MIQFMENPDPEIVGDWDAYAEHNAKIVQAEMHNPAVDPHTRESMRQQYEGMSFDEIKAKIRNDAATWAPSLASMSCVDRVLTRLTMHEYRQDSLPIDALDQAYGHSPAQTSELSGLARLTGGDAGVFADLYEANKAADDRGLPSGLVVMSQAHRTPPGSPQYREWIRGNLTIPGGGDDSDIVAEVMPWVVSSVLDVAVNDEPEADLARKALKDIAEECPDTFARGVQEFASYDVESHAEILNALASEPALREHVNRVLAPVA